MPSNIIFTLPKPRRDLNRYCNRVLLNWLERAEACRCQSIDVYNRASQTKSGDLISRYAVVIDARNMVEDIREILILRKFSAATIDEKLQQVAEDIKS